MFTLLSGGTARADAIQSARRQLATAINYVRSRADFTWVARVYSSLGETVLSALRVGLAELGVIRPRPRGRRRLMVGQADKAGGRKSKAGTDDAAGSSLIGST